MEIGTFELSKKALKIKDKRAIPTKEFLSHSDWRIELLLKMMRIFSALRIPNTRKLN